jgi:hypothetical protein
MIKSSKVTIDLRRNRSQSVPPKILSFSFKPYIQTMHHKSFRTILNDDAGAKIDEMILRIEATLVISAAKELDAKNAMSVQLVRRAVRRYFLPDLATQAISEAEKTLFRYTNYKTPPEKGNAYVHKSDKAGLTLPINRIWTRMKDTQTCTVSLNSAIYLAAIMEYVVLELLSLAHRYVHQMKQTTITRPILEMLISLDSDLKHALKF